jgi:hypothetical protein
MYHDRGKNIFLYFITFRVKLDYELYTYDKNAYIEK